MTAQAKPSLLGELGDIIALGLQHDLPSKEIAAHVLSALCSPTKEMIAEGNCAIDEHIDFYNYDSGAGYSVEQDAAYACIRAMLTKVLMEG